MIDHNSIFDEVQQKRISKLGEQATGHEMECLPESMWFLTGSVSIYLARPLVNEKTCTFISCGLNWREFDKTDEELLEIIKDRLETRVYDIPTKKEEK